MGSIIIVSFIIPLLRKSSKSGILKYNRGRRRSCGRNLIHSVHGNSIVSALYLYLPFITENKREKLWPHLLVSFFPYWVFLGYILFSLCGWCVIFLASFISVSIYFSISYIMLEVLNMNPKKNTS
jgi:hypothetical protein